MRTFKLSQKCGQAKSSGSRRGRCGGGGSSTQVINLAKRRIGGAPLAVIKISCLASLVLHADAIFLTTQFFLTDTDALAGARFSTMINGDKMAAKLDYLFAINYLPSIIIISLQDHRRHHQCCALLLALPKSAVFATTKPKLPFHLLTLSWLQLVAKLQTRVVTTKRRDLKRGPPFFSKHFFAPTLHTNEGRARRESRSDGRFRRQSEPLLSLPSSSYTISSRLSLCSLGLAKEICAGDELSKANELAFDSALCGSYRRIFK